MNAVCVAEHSDGESVREAPARSKQFGFWVSGHSTIECRLDGTTGDSEDTAAPAKFWKETPSSHSRADRSEIQLQLSGLQQGVSDCLFTLEGGRWPTHGESLLGLWIRRLVDAAPTVEASTATARDPRGIPFEPSNASRFSFRLHRLGTRSSFTSNDDDKRPYSLLMCVFLSSDHLAR